MHCPHCGSLMQEEYYGVTIDRCHSCGGIWFDADELRDALKRPASARLAADPSTFSPPIAGATLNCPRCAASPLEARKVHGAEIHGCRSCRGIFVGPEALLTILERKSYGIGNGAVDVAIVGSDLLMDPELAGAAVKGVLELVADIFSAW